jgi:6-phosphogluconolactonase (cycloisomerase 2 family)
LRVDGSGALHPHGAVHALPMRPLHVSVDRAGAYIFVAYNEPAGVTVHRIDADGSVGARVEQPSSLDVGIFPHQILATPSNRAVILVTRGNDAAKGKAEDPGALKVYGWRDGVLANRQSVAPGGGYGFGPRHLDFHPAEPWVYVSLERQNALELYRLEDDRLTTAPLFHKATLAEPDNVRPRQLGGAVHVHPNGRYVYTANRADHTADFRGRRVFAGGENSIAMFSIDARTGEPTRVQLADPRAFHVRTFAIDPSGRMLVAASILAMDVRDGEGVAHVPAALSVFRIAPDGKLAFVRKYDVATDGEHQFWMGMIG